jgi:tetratricopeptide (TPR) repeat protein
MRWSESLWLAAAAFAVYAAGACPTIYVGDSGELVTAAYQLGIAHPSGYPLYVLLGKIWTLLLPLGSIAFRMSLLSAASTAAAVGVLHSLARRLGLHAAASVFAALLFAFGPTLWGEANVQRVYGLNVLFVAATTAAAFAWHRSRSDRSLFVAFLLSGLGASNHTFMAVYALALLGFALAVAPSLRRNPRTLASCLVAFCIGLLPYLYLPLRSRANPPLDWGNPETISSFLDVVLRRGFWERAWIEGPADLAPIAFDYLRSLGTELFGVGLALALLGLWVGRGRGWPILLPLLVMAGNLLALSLHGSRSDIFIWHRYYIPSYFMAALLAGMGCHRLLESLPSRLRLLPVALPALALVAGWGRFDRSRYRIADDFSRTLLGTLPPGASLTASDDNVLFVLLYLQFVEGLRPDVYLVMEGVGGAELPPLRFHPDTDPLFMTHHPNWKLPELEIVPVGLVFQTVRSGRPWPPALVPKRELEGERDPRVPKDYLTRNLIGHFHYMLGVSFENRDWPRAAVEFEAAASAAPDNDVLFYNLGLIYRRNGLFEEALASFQRAHAINPRQLPSGKGERARDRVEELTGEVERLRALERAQEVELGAIQRDTPAFHRRMAELLEAQGEPLAARGHRVRALVRETERVGEQ